MGMELESALPTIQQPPDIEETPTVAGPAQPLVKLLQCKPMPQLPTGPPKLMLWVDGCLAPALPRPLFIDLSAAQALSRSSGPPPTPRGAAAASRPAAAAEDDCLQPNASASAFGRTTTTPPSSSSSAAVSATAAAAVRGAVDGLSAKGGGHGTRLEAQLDAAMAEEDLLAELEEVPSELPSPRLQHATAGAAHRSSSVELSPPLLHAGRLTSTKRTRPASACATSGGTQSTHGGAQSGAGGSRCGRSSADGAGAGGSLRGGSGSSLLGSSASIAEESVRSESVLGLSDVMGDWQLESPSKRPTLDSRGSHHHTPRSGLSPPALSSQSNLGAVRSADMTSPPDLRAGGLRSLPAAAPSTMPSALPTRPPTACCCAPRCCAPEPSLATPSSAAAAAAAVSAAASAASCAAASAATAACSAASSASATAEPPAPPPSPIVGARPTPRDVPWGLAKRKQRSEDLELPSSLLRVENELNSLRIEPRPNKLLRCASRT